MTAWFVVAIPPLIMFFALAMERLETRLRHITIHENVAVQASVLRRAGQVTPPAVAGLDSTRV